MMYSLACVLSGALASASTIQNNSKITCITPAFVAHISNLFRNTFVTIPSVHWAKGI